MWYLQNQDVHTVKMQKVYFAADRTWVGEVWVGRCPADATHEADIPEISDPRWISGKPNLLDTSVLTLSPFAPSNRLGACLEMKLTDARQRASYKSYLASKPADSVSDAQERLMDTLSTKQPSRGFLGRNTDRQQPSN